MSSRVDLDESRARNHTVRLPPARCATPRARASAGLRVAGHNELPADTQWSKAWRGLRQDSRDRVCLPVSRSKNWFELGCISSYKLQIGELQDGQSEPIEPLKLSQMSSRCFAEDQFQPRRSVG